RCRGGTGGCAQLIELPRTRGLRPVPDLLIELGDFEGRKAVRWVVFARELVLAARRLELIVRLVVARAIEVDARGDEHRPLERDLVFRLVRRRLNGRAVVSNRLVVIALPAGLVATGQGIPCRTGRWDE